MALEDHEQDWQPYPVDPYFCYISDHTYIIHTYIHTYTHTCIHTLAFPEEIPSD